MGTKYLFIAAALSLLIGIVTIASEWKGSAGLSAGWPPSAWAINFCGSANGLAAMVGLLCFLVALVLFLAAAVSGARNQATS